VEGRAALTRGPECSASGAEERGVSFGRSLQQRSPAAPERPLSEPRRPTTCPPLRWWGERPSVYQGGSAPTVLSGAGRGKSCKGSAPRGGFGGFQATDGRDSEGGGSGWGVEPADMGGGYGGGLSRRHAAAVPGALPQRGAHERGVGLEAWRVVHGRLEGRRPSHGEMGCAGVAPRPPGSDAPTIRVGGWGGPRRHVLRPSCTLTERVPTVG
jgi:hypothetical protein